MILVVLQGFDAGRQVRLDRGVMTIGRGADCDVILQERHASRRHAELRRYGDEWLIVDLGSTNGTYVGDTRLEANIPRSLPPEAQVAIGSTRFVLRLEAQDAPGSVPDPQEQAWLARQDPGSRAPRQPAWTESPAQEAVPDAGHLAGRSGSASREIAVWICRLVVVAGCGFMSIGALRDWIEVQVHAPLIGTTLYEQTYSGVDSGQAWLFLSVAAVAILLILADIAIPRWGLVSGLGQTLVGIIVVAVCALDISRYYQAGSQEFMGISLLDLFSNYASDIVDINVQAGVYLLALGLVLVIVGGLSRLFLAVTSLRKV